jgi:hypothetical protein
MMGSNTGWMWGGLGGLILLILIIVLIVVFLDRRR